MSPKLERQRPPAVSHLVRKPEPIRTGGTADPPATVPAGRFPEPSEPVSQGGLTAERAWEAVLDARDSARETPREWVQFSARLPEKLVARLTRRVAEDKTRHGDFTLAASHYLSAALARVPADAEAAAQWGLAWHKRNRRAPAAASAGSGSRVHRDVATAMHVLNAHLKTLEVHPRTWEVMAEALHRFLAALDQDIPSTDC